MAVDKPVLLAVRNAVIDGKNSTEWAVYSQNQTNKDLNPKTLILENCEIKNMTKKALYLTDVRSLTIKNCVFTDNGGSEDTGVSGDYGIDCNLVGVQGTSIKIEDCTFAGVQGHKACIKVTQRGYPSDKGAGDIPMDIPPAKISSLTVTGCDFTGIDGATTPIDIRIGTEHKTPEEPELYNGTGDFAVMVANNKSPVRVAVVSADPATETTVEVGQTGYKNAKGEFTVVGVTPEPEPEPEPEVVVASIDGVEFTSMEEALETAQDGDEIVLEADYDKSIDIDGKKITLNLNGHTVANPEPIWETATCVALLQIGEGSEVTIKGNGTIKPLADDVYGINVSGDSTAIIEDGTFIGNISACQVQSGHLYIKGGDFSLQQLSQHNDARYTLNCIDSAYKDGSAVIEVTGGTFKDFDPSNNLAEGEATNFCPDGYSVTEQDGIYTVAAN